MNWDTVNLSLSVCLILVITLSGCAPSSPPGLSPPNIVYILADDLGYGDVSACNSEAAWKTEHIDRIASGGMMFTDAHSGSAVCSPTRYGILTGRYAWRSRLKEGVLWSYDEPLIGTGEMTAGRLLQRNGYETGCIGKWHLGLGWEYFPGTTDSVDFSMPVSGGPLELGFDYFFGITASLDIPPYVYIENDRPTTVPNRYTENTSDMGWWRRGLTGDDFEHEQVLPVLASRATSFIDRHQKERPDDPFFLYFALPAPHTPILPTSEFRGKSEINPYGDFVLQVDRTVGEILNCLADHGISERTLVIFTSDNGCSPEADFEALARFGHDPSYLFRGHKADIFEGGHRIPFMASWPGKIESGTVSSQVICLTDLLATAAAITGDTLEPDQGVDSHNLLPLFLNETAGPVREATVHHSVNGSFAIRKGKWKLIACPGSGGWSYPLPGSSGLEGLPPFQLYDLESDQGETENLYDRFPEVVNELVELLEKCIFNGRSTPGDPQPYYEQEEWPGLSWIKSGETPIPAPAD